MVILPLSFDTLQLFIRQNCDELTHLFYNIQTSA